MVNVIIEHDSGNQMLALTGTWQNYCQPREGKQGLQLSDPRNFDTERSDRL
jgi:hypothetical protein